MHNSQTTGQKAASLRLEKRRPSAWGVGRRIELVESHPVARGQRIARGRRPKSVDVASRRCRDNQARNRLAGRGPSSW